MTSPDPDAAPPSTRAAIEASLRDLPARYRPEQAPRSERRYRIEVEGATPHVVVVDGERCVVYPSRSGPVNVTLTVTADAWRSIVDGASSGLDAFLAGEMQIHGDLNEALRMETVFAVPEGSPRALSPSWMGRYEVQGANLATFETGPPDGPIALLIHGLGASKVSLLPAIAGLADTHRVVAVDLPGFGRSTAPLRAAYDPPYFARVLLELLDRLGAGPAALVGNSLGGRVALEMALAAPQRVSGLGLLCPAVAFDAYRLIRPALALRAELIPSMAAWPIPRSTVDRTLRRMFADHRRVPADNLRAAREDFLRSIRSPRRRLAFLATARHLGKEEPKTYWPRLAELEVPSLWIFGDTDRLVPAFYADVVSLHAPPSATVQVWRSCGHVPQFEYPQRTVDALLAAFGGPAAEDVGDGSEHATSS
jgi:pimeloyl-ACP methyl ester carboxylesterase/putative sterol carrier protein